MYGFIIIYTIGVSQLAIVCIRLSVLVKPKQSPFKNDINAEE